MTPVRTTHLFDEYQKWGLGSRKIMDLLDWLQKFPLALSIIGLMGRIIYLEFFYFIWLIYWYFKLKIGNVNVLKLDAQHTNPKSNRGMVCHRSLTLPPQLLDRAGNWIILDDSAGKKNYFTTSWQRGLLSEPTCPLSFRLSTESRLNLVGGRKRGKKRILVYKIYFPSLSFSPLGCGVFERPVHAAS